MTIKQFIEKAIEGEYDNFPFVLMTKPERVWYENGAVHAARSDGDWESQTRLPMKDVIETETHRILLDPLAWQAVGKVERWKRELRMSYEGFCIDEECNPDGGIDEAYRIEEWQFHMHRMIDALAEGKSVEEFLSTL